MIKAWEGMFETGVSQEYALAVFRLALTSDITIDDVKNMAKVFRSFNKSSLCEVTTFTELEDNLAMDPSLDPLQDDDVSDNDLEDADALLSYK